MAVNDIVELFEKCELIHSNVAERDAILHAAERTYDPELLAIQIEGIVKDLFVMEKLTSIF